MIKGIDKSRQVMNMLTHIGRDGILVCRPIISDLSQGHSLNLAPSNKQGFHYNVMCGPQDGS